MQKESSKKKITTEKY